MLTQHPANRGAPTPLVVRNPWRTAILPAVLAIVVAAVVFAGRLDRQMRDFEVYWTAGARAAAADPLYRENDGHYRFKYLPGFAVAMSPLARFPLTTAKAVWFALSLGGLAAFVAVAILCVPGPVQGRVWLAALTTITMAKFFAHELVLGQVNVLFGLLCAASLMFLIRRRETLGGLGFGAAALIKPYAVVFVPYLLVTRRWSAAAAACASLAAVLALPVPVFGAQRTAQMMAEWWRTASATSVPLLTNADSTSVFAMYAKWLGWGTPAAVLSFVTVAALAFAFATVVVYRGRARSPEALEVGLLLTLIPLATPQGWDYVLLLSTPLVALIIARAPSMPPADRWVAIVTLGVVALSVYDILGRTAYRAFMAWSVITVCYLVLIAVAVRLRTRGAA